MTLTELDKNQFSEAFIEIYKQRLTGKPQPILPPGGMTIELDSPDAQNLVGSIGTVRDPNYDGPQPPNSIGMVLLVTPDDSQEVEISVSGRFDISQRYIPSIALMKKELIFDGGSPRPSQPIADTYKRFTVCFDEMNFIFSLPSDLSVWKKSSQIDDVQLANLTLNLKKDERIFRTRETNAKGKIKVVFDWNNSIHSQDDLNKAISSELFVSGSKDILEYSVELRARLREAPASLTSIPGAVLLEVFLVNLTSTDDGKEFGVNNPFLLDCEVLTNVRVGQHHNLPHKLKPEDYRHYEHDGLAGYGITCAVDSDAQGILKTNCMPVIKQWAYETPSPKRVGMSVPPTFDALNKNPLPIVASLIEALKTYGTQWDKKVADLVKEDRHSESKIAVNEAANFADEVARIERGYLLLQSNPRLLQTFRWMNKVMGIAIKKQGKSFDGWRLFQLGFVLTQIEAIYERHIPGSVETPSWDRADVLWFSTGGGKTEAYLGIICMAMLYQRLNDRNYGTSAWLRFPLRMLSVQQFQRLSYVVAQANVLRQEENLGGHPFTIGYFTGRGTPSSISSSSEYGIKNFLPLMSTEALEAYKFISDCPYCDAKHSVDIKKDLSGTRIKHVCKNPECWSNTSAGTGQYGEGIRGEIGIFVSDEECYRYLPTVLVGTIDKLAVIAHNVRFKKFFGSSQFFCPTHGFTQSGVCEHNRISQDTAGEYISVKCENNSRTSPIKTIKIPAMVDPGFSICIQDELHLLKETLGNFDGHYETLLQSLQILLGGKSPKIIAATATIKDYDNHIHHLYQKEATRYPAPGIKQGESFYSRRKTTDDNTPLVRRYFTSILPVSRRNPVRRAISDSSSRFLDLVDESRELFRSDPATAASRFNVDPAKAAAALEYLEEHLNTNLIYANQKRDISEVGRFLEEENGKRGTERLCTRLDGESSLEHIQETIEHIETKLPTDERRQIIATSVVSHGVDIERLNFMVISGWPTSTAEYIQSSARSGRVQPGIIMTILSYMKTYEHTVFLNFTDYHQFLDKMVESVPINRFAPNIIERTLPGIIAAVILNWAPSQPWGSKITSSIREIHKVFNEKGSPARKDIEKAVLQALHIGSMEASQWFDKRVVDDFTSQVKTQVQRGLSQLETWGGGHMDMYLGEALERIYGYRPLVSFRDIERQISINAIHEDLAHTTEALRR